MYLEQKKIEGVQEFLVYQQSSDANNKEESLLNLQK